MMDVHNLLYSYAGSRAAVLQNISFRAASGEVSGILGNNGAGKSTLLKCLCGITRPKRGAVRVDGKDIFAMRHRDLARLVSFVPQEAAAARLSVYDTVMMGRSPYFTWGAAAADRHIVQNVMRRMDIEHIALKFVNELSGGERQKVMLARSLAQNPKVLLLDEPTSSLDLKNQHEVLGLVRAICRERDITVVMVIHDINLALKYCDRFILMKEHELFAFGGSNVITEKNIEAVFGIPVALYECGGEKVVLPLAGSSATPSFAPRRESGTLLTLVPEVPSGRAREISA